MKNIQQDISKLIETDSGAKGAKKSVSFKISTCAQLDRSVEEEIADDTVSVHSHVIDEGSCDNIVKEVVNEIVETVVEQKNEAVDAGVHVDA